MCRVCARRWVLPLPVLLLEIAMFAFLPAETRVAQRVHLIHLTPERPFPSLFVMTLSFTRPVEETATGYAHNLQPTARGSPDLLHNKMRNSWGTVTCDRNSGGPAR